jgi:plasmid stability protein
MTYYISHMDTTIRNLDPDLYRKLRARAASEGKTVGEAVSEAMRAYLGGPPAEKTGSLRDLTPELFPPGNEHLSEEVDDVVYGTPRRRKK